MLGTEILHTVIKAKVLKQLCWWKFGYNKHPMNSIKPCRFPSFLIIIEARVW